MEIMSSPVSALCRTFYTPRCAVGEPCSGLGLTAHFTEQLTDTVIERLEIHYSVARLARS